MATGTMTILSYAFWVVIILAVAYLVLRAGRIARANVQVVANQQKLIALTERQAAALERIAAALEERG